MFSKRHYEFLAQFIASLDPTEELSKAAIKGILAAHLHRENPKFKPETFYKYVKSHS